MIDENALGLWVSYYAVEDEEYGCSREEFVDRVHAFRRLVHGALAEKPPARSPRVLDFGHAVYVEFAEEDEAENPIGWLRGLRAELKAADYGSAAILTHGSRWVAEEGEELPEFDNVIHVSHPSEPLRRALYADAATRHDEESGQPGWGTGLYLDTEAVEALGLKLKNTPTPLSCAGATFYRVGS